MGRSKAWLDWHGTPLLERVVEILSRAVPGPLVVVRASGQALPALPAGVLVIEDHGEGRGPVEGLATGLSALAGQADAAFVCATDMPFVHPAFVGCLVDALGASCDVAMPVVDGFGHPLAAVYRTSVGASAREAVGSGTLRLGALLGQVRTRRMDEAELLADAGVRRADRLLQSVRGVNDPLAYERALTEPLPEVRVASATAAGLAARRQVVPAATVAGAAQAVGLAAGPGLRMRVQGERFPTHGRTPLVRGDLVWFGR